MKKVLEVEELGLSINKSALILNVDMASLWRFINEHNLSWRGKGKCYKHGEVNPNSELQKIKKSGLNRSTIIYRINVMGMTLEQAIARGSSNK